MMEMKEVDKELVDELYNRILGMEMQNAARKSKSDPIMVQEIKKLIEEKVQCFYRV